jgi:hypothetical protein
VRPLRLVRSKHVFDGCLSQLPLCLGVKLQAERRSRIDGPVRILRKSRLYAPQRNNLYPPRQPKQTPLLPGAFQDLGAKRPLARLIIVSLHTSLLPPRVVRQRSIGSHRSQMARPVFSLRHTTQNSPRHTDLYFSPRKLWRVTAVTFVPRLSLQMRPYIHTPQRTWAASSAGHASLRTEAPRATVTLAVAQYSY